MNINNKTLDLKLELNEPQYEAAVNIEGASLIIAGAGSGKTRTLTYRIAYMISQGIPPYNILALTFTNKAASEMRERIKDVVGWENSHYLWMGTFHSIFSRILRSEPAATGFPATYTIYDTTDSRSLIKSIVKELGYDEKVYKPADVLARISSAKNALVTPQGYAANAQYTADDAQSRKPLISNIYTSYANKCKRANAMDFDDLLLRTNILFRDHREVLEKYQNQFHYILVDEYQDTNYSQYMIVKRLAESRKNICVVGDDAQSIYAFRGARIENILNFRNDYPDYKEFKLEQNYRSTQNIVNAANSVIKNNSQQLKKKCFSRGEEGEKIGVIKAFTDQEEGFLIADSIADTIRRQGAEYNDFAVLYRTNAQSRVIEESLRRKGFPYKIYGGVSFYQRAEIKNFLAYLRICVNHNDDEAFKRIINYPARGIGETSVLRLQEAANIAQLSLFESIQAANLAEVGLKGAMQTKLQAFVTFVESLTAKAFTTDAFEFAGLVAAQSGMLADLKNEKSAEGIDRYENIEELLNSIKSFCDDLKANGDSSQDEVITINEYLDNVALITDADNEKEEDRNKISLMTVHQAKGLEYKYVYIAGMEENLFPSSMSNMNLFDIEEERRLFYVALTRAKSKATVSFAQSRYRWGEVVSNAPSRFVREIDEKYLEESISAPQQQNNIFGNKEKEQKPVRPSFTTSTFIKRPVVETHEKSANFTPSNADDIRNGMRIEHERFGFGKVISVEGAGADKKVVVVFDNNGTKTLLLRFAKLMIVKE